MTGRHRRGGRRLGLHKAPRRSAGAGSAPVVVVSGTAVVSLLNYAFSVALLWILPTRQYTVVASVTALLLVFGTVAGASAPWILAREVAMSSGDARRRQRAVAFATAVGLGESALAAAVCSAVVASYADWQVTVTACASAVVIFMAATAVGYVQGTERFKLIAYLRVGEVAVKIAAGIALVELGSDAWGAISGFGFGASIVLLGAVWHMRADVSELLHSWRLPWVRRAVGDRAMWASAGGIVGIQAGTAVIAGLDVIVGSIMLSGSIQLAHYQVIQIIGRIPFYIASALAIIVFPRMARIRTAQAMTVSSSLRVWIRVCGGAAAVVASLPQVLLVHIISTRYGSASALLPWAALSGFSLGGVNLVTTYWQAVGRCRRAATLLFVACATAAIADALALRSGDILHLAWCASATSGAALVSLVLVGGTGQGRVGV